MQQYLYFPVTSTLHTPSISISTDFSTKSMIYRCTTTLSVSYIPRLSDLQKYVYKHGRNETEITSAIFYYTVGAGTAGASLSAKLAKYGYKILLLEAGGVAPPFLDIPLLAPLIQNTPYDWQYTTVPQENACKGLINNVSYLIITGRRLTGYVIKTFSAKQMANGQTSWRD